VPIAAQPSPIDAIAVWIASQLATCASLGVRAPPIEAPSAAIPSGSAADGAPTAPIVRACASLAYEGRQGKRRPVALKGVAMKPAAVGFPNPVDGSADPFFPTHPRKLMTWWPHAESYLGTDDIVGLVSEPQGSVDIVLRSTLTRALARKGVPIPEMLDREPRRGERRVWIADNHGSWTATFRRQEVRR